MPQRHSRQLAWLLCCAIFLFTACASTPPPSPTIALPLEEADQELQAFTEESLYALLVAEVAGHRGEYDDALAGYLEQAQATQDMAVIRRAARLAKFLNRGSEARTAASLWLAQEPDNIEALDLMASTLRQQNQLIEAFDELLKVKLLGVTTDFGRISAKSLDLEPKITLELLRRYDAALEQMPDDIDLLIGKSIVQQRFNPEEALKTVRRAGRIAPDAQKARVIGIEATILQRSGLNQQAMDLLAAEVLKNPEHRALNLQYARLLTQQDLVKARLKLSELHDRYPHDTEVTWSLALVDFELKLYVDAANLLQAVLEDPRFSNQAYFYLGELRVLSKQPEQAAQYFEQVGPGDDFSPALLKLARIRIENDQYDLFHQHLAELRSRFPDVTADLYLFEAELLLKLGREQEYASLLDSAIAASPDDAGLRYARSLAYERAGNFVGAEADLRHILSAEADNATALNALGYMLTVHTNRYSEAKVMIAQALLAHPDDPAVLDSMGWVNFKLGNFDDALVYLQAAYKRDQDPEIAAHLGEVLWQLQRQDEALDIWQKVLAEDPENSPVRAAALRLGATLEAPTSDAD